MDNARLFAYPGPVPVYKPSIIGNRLTEKADAQIERTPAVMSKLANLKVKLFTDGADKAQIVEMAKQPWIAGFTTNPSLLKKAGVQRLRSLRAAISSPQFPTGTFRSRCSPTIFRRCWRRAA